MDTVNSLGASREEGKTGRGSKMVGTTNHFAGQGLPPLSGELQFITDVPADSSWAS
jgi:hypothetical protein